MNEKTKLTKKDYFEELKNIVNQSDSTIRGELIYFIESQIATIEKKANYAKRKAEEKKEKEDDLKVLIQKHLSAIDWSSIEDLINILQEKENIEVTKAKIVPRLTQLHDEGIIEKAKTEKSKKIVTVYRLN